MSLPCAPDFRDSLSAFVLCTCARSGVNRAIVTAARQHALLRVASAAQTEGMKILLRLPVFF